MAVMRNKQSLECVRRRTSDLRATDFQQVDGFPTDVNVSRDMTEEHRHAVLGVLRDQSVALHPEMLIYRETEGRDVLGLDTADRSGSELCMKAFHWREKGETSARAHLCSSGSPHSPGS